ncbi:hypothetical protein BOTCAL_0009g00130 [Botryotinia calthae]|uniref:Zn(2)-C6 fungal-type domain-containing protein n=1 Tax=Botryotinia calthae TaxID=38488 RepID=A0A4Y8DGH6_9HELO|nr:hypothetical protein BOTCAL_0009g00130 [Botryotinia calthae]
MNRRSHRKSRKGCLQCKSRHIKCDETHPECVNCKTASHKCSYKIPASTNTSKVTTPESAFTNSPTPTFQSDPQTPHGPSLQPPPSLPPSLPPALPQSYVNFTHLELFQHFYDDKNFLWDGQFRGHKSKIIKYAYAAPFLMYELLACSALHLSIIRPDKFQFYHDESSALQEQSMKMFNESVQEVHDDNLIPAFMYSGVLGLHFFADTFSVPGSDLNQFIDKLVQAIKLMRGVRVCFTGWWGVLMESEIRDIIQYGDGGMEHTDDFVDHLLVLQTKLPEIPGIEEAEIGVLLEAVRQLRWVYVSSLFNIQNGTPSPGMITSWPVTLPVEFADLIDQRRPGALIVLAQFSIILHVCRDFWAVGNAGKFLFTVVETYLGRDWESWLEWPKSKVLESESV